jgi:TP901 family phage tail tape measure protein
MAQRVSYTFFAVDKFSAIARRISASTEAVRGKMRALDAQLKKVDKSASVALGKKLRGVSLAAGVAAGASVKAFGDLEAGVVNVLTLLEDDKAVEKYRGRIKGLIESTVAEGFSIEDASAAVFDNVKALGASEKSFGAYTAALDLARATNTDINASVGGVSAVMKAYGLEATDATRVTDAFVVAQRRGIRVGDMAENVAKIAPLAKQAGIGFEELFATTAQLTKKGMDPAGAAQAVKAAIVALVKPGKTAEKMFRALGIPVGVAELRSAGLAATLSKLAVVGQKYPDIMDQLIPNVRALTAAAALGGPELAAIQKTIVEMNTAATTGAGVVGALEKQEATFNDTLGDTIGEVKILASMIGEGLAPVIKVVGFVVHALVVGLRALGPVASKILGGLLGAVAIAAPVLLFFGKFLLVMGAIGGAIVGALSAPIAFIAVLIAAFVAAVAVVVANVDSVTDKAVKVKNAVSGFFGFGAGAKEVDASFIGDVMQRNQTDINVNLNAPKGAISSVKTQTTGDTSGLNVGVNMAGAF